MKKLNTGPITDSAKYNVKKGTLDFLQDAPREIVEQLIRSLIGSAYNPSVVYAMRGVINTGSDPVYNTSAGAVFLGGEVYEVDAAGFTAAGGETAIYRLVTTQYTTNADPVILTDTTTHQIHDIRKLEIVSGVAGTGVADYSQTNFFNFVIYPQLNLTAPSTGVFTGNGINIIGSYPDIQLFAPGTMLPILTHGSAFVGNIETGGNVVPVVFGTPLATADYKVMGEFTCPDINKITSANVTKVISNKTVNGFTLTCKEWEGSTTQVLTYDYIIFKNP